MNPAFILVAVLLTAMILVCSFFLKSNENIVTVNVGILAEEPDAVTEKAFGILLGGSQLNFMSFDASQKDEMIEMVKSRRLECAYIFDKDLLGNVRRERFDKIITVVSSPATVASGIVNELVFSAVINSSADILSAEIAAGMFGLDATDIEGVFTEKIESYHENELFLRPVFQRENSYDENVSNVFAVRIVHGIWITLLFIFSYFMIPMYVNDKKDGLYKMLNTPKILIYFFTQLLASFLALFTLSVFCMVLLRLAVPETLLPIWKELIGAAVFFAVVQSISLFFVLIMKSDEPIYAGFIFVLLFQIMFGNLFLDLREISAVIGRFQVLPSAYYMNYLLNSQSLCVPVVLFFIFILMDAVLILIFAKR